MPLNEIELKTILTWLKRRNIVPDKVFLEKISGYHDLLTSWSNRINLVSKKDREFLLNNHILDSLGPLETIPSSGSLIDIGSGAGFPGIPLAIARPILKITLLESTHKKILFLRAVKKQLRLENVLILEGRLENLTPLDLYDIATIRALPDWESYLAKIKGLLKPDGRIIYYRYRDVYDEIRY